MEKITVNGTEVLIEGQGDDTIVLIHGAPDTRRVWDGTVPALQDRYRCARFTLPGFDVPAPVLSLPELTARLLAIVDAVSPGKPVTLLLHDWGSIFGHELAVRHPERIRRIVAVDVGDATSPDFVRSLALRHKLMVMFYQVWLAKCWVLGRFVHAGFANYWTRMMARMMRAPAPMADIHWSQCWPYAMNWFGLAGGLRGLSRKLPQCPELFIYGTRKPFMFHSQRWVDQLNATPGSKAISMKTGHWVMLDQPQAFNATVLDWLAN